MGNTLGITAEFARKILKADLAKLLEDNIDKSTGKLRKTLPAGVRRMLAQAGAVGADDEPITTQLYATTKRELARLIPCSIKSLDRWLKESGRPVNPTGQHSRYDVAAWKAYARTKPQVGRGLNGALASEPEVSNIRMSPKDLALLGRMETKLEKDKLELGILKRQYIPRAEVNFMIAKANIVVIRELTKAFEHELPPLCEGLNAAEIQVLNADKLREVLTKLPQKIMSG